MHKSAAFLAAMLLAASAHAGTRFVAADVPAAKLRTAGRVTISNDGTSITAWHFDGNIREALHSLRSIPVRAVPDSEVFKPGARVSVPAGYGAIIDEASRAHGVDARLIAAVVRQESSWNPRAVSPVGAQGLMQLMPATARYLGVNNAFDARENVMAGTRYLRTLLETFNGDVSLALAAYNAGPGAVARHRGIPPYRETRNYVAKITKAYYER
jgi:soluble lytic murein transglycosylase-like protein